MVQPLIVGLNLGLRMSHDTQEYQVHFKPDVPLKKN